MHKVSLQKHMSRMFMKISENFPVRNVIMQPKTDNNSKGIRIVFIKRKATIA